MGEFINQLSTKLFLIFVSSLFSFQIFSLYRPYDIYRPSASSLAQGGTGVSNIDTVSDVIHNPAYLAATVSNGFAFAIDLSFRIQRLDTRFAFQPYYIPVLNFVFPYKLNHGFGVSVHSLFRRSFPDEFYNLFFWEAGYAYTLHRYWYIGLTFGVAMGVQNNRFVGAGASYSLGIYFENEHYTAGLYLRPPSRVFYSTFSNSSKLVELTPLIFRLGGTKKWKSISLTIELEYIDWQNSSFVLNNVNETPTLKPHFLYFIHPHIGVSFKVDSLWPGLKIKTGIFTEDYFNTDGGNSRQILFTFGLGGKAGSTYWGERLHIDVAYVSSALFSLFWKENHQIEKIVISLSLNF